MTKTEIEKLLKRITRANEMLAIAQANITESNAMAIDIIMSLHRQDGDNQSPPTMQ